MLPHATFKTLRTKFIESLSDLFTGKNTSGSLGTDHGSGPMNSVPSSIQAVQREFSEATRNRKQTAHKGNFNHAHDFVVVNPTIVDNSTTNYHTPSDREVKVKELLLKHAIVGAAHNSSARDPPPRCHPGTRIKINERILAWFYNAQKSELILWIYGPAGVGKSAIVQTIAEALAAAKCLGASVFFSRPNGRNASRSIFITIAYQLAVHIEDYCVFISEKLAADPELVTKGLEEQFRTFVVEPFAEKKIGAGGKTWGILLDGLDELDERHWQREIIRLITTFALEYPDIPLVWVIASRPEPHILDKFKAPETVPSYWEEHVPIDSPEACQDVERYIKSSFDTICRDFPRIVPQDWPDEIQIVRLAHAASGLFAFAEVAVRFIGNPDHADPDTRLQDVLRAIDGSAVNAFDNAPFARLDALYICILSSISPEMWPITKRVLGTLLHLSGPLRCVKGLSVLLDCGLSKIYTSINDLYSVIKIPLDDVYSQSLSFYHASFTDFLRDNTRSKQFCISWDDARRDSDECGVRIWQDFKKKFPRGPSSEYYQRWFKYTPKFHLNANPPESVSKAFNHYLFRRIHNALLSSLQENWHSAHNEPSRTQWDQFLDLVCQVDASTACYGWGTPDLFVKFLFDMWKTNQDRLTEAGIIHEIQLEQLRLDHLQWPKEIATHYVGDLGVSTPSVSLYQAFTGYMTGLKYIRKHNPELKVLIYGTSKNRCAAFIYQYLERDLKECPFHIELSRGWNLGGEHYGYYCIPYPYNV